MGSLTQVKSRIANWFDRYFPGYAKVFKSWDGKASLMTMREFPTPEEIVSKGARDILAFWKTEVKRGVGIKRAEHLCAAAEVSIGLKEGLVAARVQLRMLLEEFELYMKQEEHELVRTITEIEESELMLPHKETQVVAHVIEEGVPARSLEPRPAQKQALEVLAKTLEEQYDKAMVVMAAGLGKTYLAAFFAQKYKRVTICCPS